MPRKRVKPETKPEGAGREAPEPLENAGVYRFDRFNKKLVSVPIGRTQGRDEPWRIQFDQELAKLDKLPRDNGNLGPKRPESNVVGIASRIPKDVKPGTFSSNLVMLTATSEGGIQVKWHDPKREFSVFIYPDNTLEYLIKDIHGRHQSGTLRGLHEVNEFADMPLA